jgi:flagellar motor switch/type III secretory pathway protein FliN
MAAEAGTARALEKPPGKLTGEAGTSPPSPVAGGHETADDRRWKPVLELPCEFMVNLPLPGFKIADLLKLRPGSVVKAHWRVGQDVPLQLNGTLIGWGEFEVMGNRLAVRLTELV